MKTFTSYSLKETSDFAQEWLERLSTDFPKTTDSSQDTSREAITVGLSGHLGAGKTAFVKAVAKHLGITEEITSPTFVIMKLYPTRNDRWKKLVHIDAYRLESGKEFEVLGFEKLVADKNNLILIEWPENVRAALEGLSDYRQLNFKIDDVNEDKNARTISEDCVG